MQKTKNRSSNLGDTEGTSTKGHNKGIHNAKRPLRKEHEREIDGEGERRKLRSRKQHKRTQPKKTERGKEQVTDGKWDQR